MVVKISKKYLIVILKRVKDLKNIKDNTNFNKIY